MFVKCLHVLQRVSGLRGAQLQLVRATPQEAQQYKEEEHQARLQAIHDAAGHQSLAFASLCLAVCLIVSVCLSDWLSVLFLPFYLG